MSTPSGEKASSSFDELIFKRELNEVHLLLDFISGRPEVHIGSIDLKMPKPGYPNETLNTFETITYVCKLRYPPDSNVSNRAADAALVTLVKDKLSSLAYPARGATIAYTYSFIEPAGYLTLPGENETETERRQTRTSVAREAYPGLYRNARHFRWTHRLMTTASIILTIVAALLLWQVTYGVQITARFEDDRKRDVEATDKIYEQVKLQEAKSQSAAPNHPMPLERCHGEYIGYQNSDISLLCNEWAYAQARYVKTISDACTFATHFPSNVLMIPFPSEIGTEKRQCRDRRHTEVTGMMNETEAGEEDDASVPSTRLRLLHDSASTLHSRAERELAPVTLSTRDGPRPTGTLHEPTGSPHSPASSTAPGTSSSTNGVHPVPKPKTGDDTTLESATQEDIQSITLVLSIYSNYVLPIMFGLLGTAASMLRSVGDKIKDCVLAPRDAALAFLRLPLGLMAGVAVGLFFNPTSVAQGISAGTGALTITASGIAFLAGYGAEAFFKMIDRMINQIFSLEHNCDAKKST
ncbi:hypothetical protein AB4Y32_31875 [Paraburkholderia phymatum]|uniref:Uncharacterized protein n=1 Tax=Paraburkholderia phymatum TaxID=148447 RepID=A0ACC6U9V1_9BURK